MLDIFNYPFDASKIFRARGDIRDALAPKASTKIKLYILSGSTTGELPELISVFLLNFGIDAEVRCGDYNTYYEDALFGSEIDEFNPDWAYIHTTFRNIKQLPAPSDTRESVDKLLSDQASIHQQVMAALTKRQCRVIANNFERPLLRVTGSASMSHFAGHLSFVRALNDTISEMVNEADNVYLNDIDYLSSVAGLDSWHNLKYWHAFKYAVGPEHMALLASSIASIIGSVMGKAKKVLVSDLDNTLWGGVIGDDGVDGLDLGPGSARGEQFLDAHHYLQDLRARGIALAVNSKNEDDIAKTGFGHADSALSVDDFASFVANWHPKSENMKTIAQELNLNTDSFVFIDDNEAERAEVTGSHPEIATLSFKKSPMEAILTLERLGLFETETISREDLQRSTYYTANKKRLENTGADLTFDQHLEFLEMRAEIGRINPSNKQRAFQLINKTNQFNPTTKRIDEKTLADRMSSENDILLYARLTDRFGDNGLVSFLLASVEDDVAKIDTWVMSCRVFKRELEMAIFDALVTELDDKNIRKVEGHFIPTAKNGYVTDLYDRLGFECVSTDGEKKHYQLETGECYQPQNRFTKVTHVRD